MERGLEPDILISSSANRAISTARIIAGSLGIDPSLVVEDRALYLASPEELIQVVSGVENRHSHAMLFGHNPGFELVADALLRKSAIERMPTCAVADIQLDVENWADVDEAMGDLLEYFDPKMLA